MWYSLALGSPKGLPGPTWLYRASRYLFTKSEMMAFADAYDRLKSLELPKACIPSGLTYTSDNWMQLVGKRKYFRDLVRIMRQQVRNRGDTTGSATGCVVMATVTVVFVSPVHATGSLLC